MKKILFLQPYYEKLCIMKKYLSLLLLAALLVAGFNSCKPDEEIYNPTCKISKIWYRSNSDWDHPNEHYIYDDKGKQLQQIVVDSVYTFDFSYNKDKTVSKIVHKHKEGYTETIDFQWTNRLVDKMTYTIDGAVRLEYTFHRIDNKKDKAYGRIDYIDETYDREFYDQYFWKGKCAHPLYDMVFGNYEKIAEVMATSDSKDLMLYSTKRFTYDPGKHKKYENIAKYVEEFPTKQTVITHTYTYDVSSYNPFYGLPFAYAEVKGYYLNLPLSEHEETTVAGSLSKVEDIVYSYDGVNYMNDKNYPREFITEDLSTNVPVHTYILYKK